MFFSGPLGREVSPPKFWIPPPPKTITKFRLFLDILHIFSPQLSNSPPPPPPPKKKKKKRKKNYISRKNPASSYWHWPLTILQSCHTVHGFLNTWLRFPNWIIDHRYFTYDVAIQLHFTTRCFLDRSRDHGGRMLHPVGGAIGTTNMKVTRWVPLLFKNVTSYINQIGCSMVERVPRTVEEFPPCMLPF